MDGRLLGEHANGVPLSLSTERRGTGSALGDVVAYAVNASVAKSAGAEPPPELLEVIEIVLLSVSELTDYLSSIALRRAIGAIEILERLLLDAGVAPWAYVRALPFASAESRRALGMLRKAR